MAWSDLATRTTLSSFRSFGQAATYTPAGGDAVAVTVIFSRPTEDGGFGEAGFRGRVASAELRLAEVASPAKGDTLEVDGTVYVVAAAPEIDSLGLVARLALRPQ